MKLKDVAINATVVIGTLALIYLAWVFRQALVLFVFSLAFAAAARPTVERLSTRGIPRTMALILVYVLVIGMIVAIFGIVGSSLLNELQRLADTIARGYDRIWNEWPEGTEIQQAIVQVLPAPADLYERFSPEQQNSTLQTLLGFTTLSASFLGQLATILILSIYWSIDRVHFERLWLSLLPVESRSRSRDIWRNVERDFGSYIRSELLQSLLAGILLGIGLWAMGVPYPGLLALFGAVVWLIPWLGGVLAVLPIALTALSQSLGLAIFASAYAIGVLFFLELFVEPRFIRRGQFSTLLSILLIIALVEPFGLLGVIVAPPLAAAIELIIRYNLAARPASAPTQSVEQVSQLRARLLSIEELSANSPEPLNPQTANMLERLRTLVDRADTILEEENSRR